MKSQGFLQTPQDIMEEYNGCSVPQYTAYPRVVSHARVYRRIHDLAPCHNECRVNYFQGRNVRKYEGINISGKDHTPNPAQERQKIIDEARRKGLQLSKDGQSWIPINQGSSNETVGTVSGTAVSSGLGILVSILASYLFLMLIFGFLFYQLITAIFCFVILQGGSGGLCSNNLFLALFFG